MKRSIQLIVLVLMVLCQNTGSAVAQTCSYDGTISVVLWGTKRNVYIGGEPKTSEWTMDKAFGAVLLKKAS